MDENYTHWQPSEEGFLGARRSVRTLASGGYVPGEDRFDRLTLSPTELPTFLPLGNRVRARVLDGIERFWRCREKYELHGLPHKRGILLHGPAGTGKSTILYDAAAHVVERGGLVLVGYRRIIAAYELIREVEGDRPIVVLLEDIDGVVDGDESRVLNLLDGVGAASWDNILFLATTNHFDRLPETIRCRPSRFDMTIEVPPPDEDDRRLFLEGIMKMDSPDWPSLTQVVEDTAGFSLAHLKEFYLAVVVHEYEYVNELKRLRQMLTTGRVIEEPTAVSNNPFETEERD